MMAPNITDQVSFNRLRFQAPFFFVTLMDPRVAARCSGGRLRTGTQPRRRTLRPSRLCCGTGQRHFVTAQLSKRVYLDGSEEWHTDLSFGGSHPFVEGEVEQVWEDFLKRAPATARDYAGRPKSAAEFLCAQRH